MVTNQKRASRGVRGQGAAECEDGEAAANRSGLCSAAGGAAAMRAQAALEMERHGHSSTVQIPLAV